MWRRSCDGMAWQPHEYWRARHAARRAPFHAASRAGAGAACVTLVGVAGLVAITSNYVLFQAENNAAAMTDLVGDQRGVISGLLNQGLIAGESVMGAIFAFSAAALIVVALAIAVSAYRKPVMMQSGLIVARKA
jgi:hypothetical protein